MFKRKSFKFVAVLLAMLMTASVFAMCPLAVMAATPGEHTVNTYYISNDYLKVAANEDCISCYTTGGDPANTRDNNKNLLFGSFGNGTSDAVINVGGSTTTFSATSKATPDGTSLYAVATYNGVKVERYISFAYNTYTSRYDAVEYKYVMTNTANTTKSAGVRIFFDTMLGDNDHAPFRVNGEDVTTGRTYTGANIPRVWHVMDSLTNPTVVASGTFYQNEADRPDKVQFLSYGAGAGNQWDCTASGSIGDSAVNVYFNPINLAPGESRTVKTYYGLSEVIPPDPEGQLGFTCSVPSEIQTNGLGTEYTGNPFVFSGWATNTGNATLTNVKATISLPAGLTTTDSRTVQLGSIAAGANKGWTWSIKADDVFGVSKTLSYTVTVEADGVDPQTYEYSIFVPALSVHEHDYALTGSTPATCTENGYNYYACTVCGEELVEYVPALGHDDHSAVTLEATCTTPGIITTTCDRCGRSYDTFVYASHHHEVIDSQDATCTEDGWKLYQCVYCPDSYTEIIPGGHDYVAEITRVATATQEGLITYTCSKCGDTYTVTIPARPDANVLLIQDRFPWTEDINEIMLARLQEQGYITGWDITTTSNLADVSFADYNIIYIANDQATSTYNRLAGYNSALESFARAGGVVIYGACDHGWASGDISYALPGNVTKGNYYSYYNYVANGSHPIVTGELTDGKAITNELLYSTYSSHTYFNANTLPEGAVVILQDANGKATLVEYPLGDGLIIASGLTWEYTYVRNYVNGTSFAKNVYDDLIVYAAYRQDACDHIYDAGVTVEPTCTERGYDMHTCMECGAVLKDNYVDELGHLPSDWIDIGNNIEVIRCEREGCDTELGRRQIVNENDPAILVIPSTTTVILHDTVEIFYVARNIEEVKALALQLVFDSDVFELVSVDFLRDDAMMQNIEAGTNRCVSAWSSFTDINGNIYRIVLRAERLTNSSTVSAEALVQVPALEQIGVVGVNLSVINCPHTNCTVQDVNDDYHALICDFCGYTTLEAHEFDFACDTDCNLCGHVREPQHVPGDVWEYDEHQHWLCCIYCGESMMHDAHDYGENGMEIYCTCCGYQRVLRGDVNGDGFVDVDDAIYLLMYTFYYEMTGEYPINQNGDFDGNGTVDSDDAIRLLMHVFFPDDPTYALY